MNISYKIKDNQFSIWLNRKFNHKRIFHKQTWVDVYSDKDAYCVNLTKHEYHYTLKLYHTYFDKRGQKCAGLIDGPIINIKVPRDYSGEITEVSEKDYTRGKFLRWVFKIKNNFWR